MPSNNNFDVLFVTVEITDGPYGSGEPELTINGCMDSGDYESLRTFHIGGITLSSFRIATNITPKQYTTKFINKLTTLSVLQRVREIAEIYHEDDVFEPKDIELPQADVNLQCPECFVIYNERESRNPMIFMDGQNWVKRKSKCINCVLGK